MASTPGMRIGDADREALASELREHYAHGRLTLDEFQQRLDATFTAKTDVELRRITADLPHQPSTPPTTTPPWTPPPAPTYQPWQGQQTGWNQRRGIGAFARLAWLLATVLLIAGVFAVLGHGGNAGRPLIVLLAIFAFFRLFARRLLGGGRSPCSRRRHRRWPC